MPYTSAASVNSYGYGIGTATTAATSNYVGIDYGLGSCQTVVYAVYNNVVTNYDQQPLPTCVANNYTYVTVAAQAPLTDAEIAELAEKQKKFDEERVLIDLRAREILEATLDAMQREQFKKESFFDLEVSSGRVYRIKPGRKVERLDPKTRKATSLFCIHPCDSLPADDIAVSQKMWLETDEEAFIRIANETKIGDYDVAA